MGRLASTIQPGMKAKLIGLGVAGLLAGTGAAWITGDAGPDRPQVPSATLVLLVGWSLIGSGLLSWRARPENRVGPIMVGTGFLWFASVLQDAHSALPFTVGYALQVVYLAGFVYLILAFPSGRLRGMLDRALVVVAFGSVTIAQLAFMLVGKSRAVFCAHCPANLLEVSRNDTLAHDLMQLQRVAGLAVILTGIGVLLTRWRGASGPQRKAAAPVLLAGAVAFAALTMSIVADVFALPHGDFYGRLAYYAFAAVPVAVLFVFLQRTLARAGVAGLVVALGEPSARVDLRQALARALGDPSLEVAYWYPAEGRYVDSDGRPVALPERDTDRLATLVEREGEPVALLIHDPALAHNAELVDSVCAAAGLTLENERLKAELRARLVELQASRARLVEATDAERRRIERDLHDGTQQRLVSIAMSLGLLESKLPGSPEQARPIVHETRAALTAALEELRELTQGIHPTILVERGLATALDELCHRSALPARLQLAVDERLLAQVESAAYFLVSEALTNVAKHSHASEVRVVATYEDAVLTVEVGDDGIGAAAAGSGSGLRGLADRVEALGGRFTISSPPGRGTRLRAEIPCA
jgi:signal transduction histidine kinase